ncbi:uncharacterized protein PITG_05876 [Phytophthora infestans T30-4]|uniref:Myb/SANT-like domain-containing protein n=1 Tax=Phytophthora infestans (strain T30-4) TaxID=403677 RepID=D0N5W5_PHYIT|nr:uncharacterized protein PITG_05876 [Phytophthora infestans T30-4]EEY70456.1 conserved hypothetical protein [Phytophthora infestans T30-4]|eukprot:XP_002998110.1 conserved hypothetical protein [Phytophthora infestans T30-4]
MEQPGKCQSKYQRLMAQYKTYRFTSNLSGAGVDSKSHRVLVADSVWSDLIAKADANTGSTYRQLQRTGFVHADVCALIAGDSVATGEEGESFTNFAAEGLNKAAESLSGSAEQGSGNSSVASDEEKRQLPPSHQQRSSKVKRLRKGRSEAAAVATAAAAANDRALEAFIAACNASEPFFKKRTKQIEQIGTRTRDENADSDGSYLDE